LIGILALTLLAASRTGGQRIDRHALVTRHHVVLTAYDGERPIQVGNGEFAFGMDITGLQTFAPFNTMSHWGWHSSPLPAGQRLEDFEGQVWDTHGRPVRYPMPDPERPELSQWMAANPHRINLGRIGLILTKRDGSEASPADLRNARQTLDLWTGVVTSRFEIDGEPVTVVTAAHSRRDTVAARIDSPLIKEKRLAAFLSCPGNNPLQFANFVGDWTHPGQFVRVSGPAGNRAYFVRSIDGTSYHVGLEWDEDATLQMPQVSNVQREILLKPSGPALSFTCTFSPGPITTDLPDAAAVIEASRENWPRFWKGGGALDLSGSKDPRWEELERRVVLSQYLMAVNEAGTYPPQESGLVNNGWYGRFHMEMLWWHAAHWALWDRWQEVDRSLDIYKKLLPSARKLAASEGYRGARWPKCIGPDLREWPHEIHALLIWQQPHPIFFAELDYRAHPTRKTLLKWQPIVDATADFLASYAFFDESSHRYVLGPPLQVVSENADARRAMNPAFELSYWRFGLRTAQVWRRRLGLPPQAEWDKVLEGLAPLPMEDGLYVLDEGVKDMWTKFNYEHPALIGTFGMLPGDGVDHAAIRRTLDKVVETWDFKRTWGWDFPMLAMCAARLREPERAIDFLLTSAPGFQFDARGLATGGPFPYFPSNGGLLYAVAMMAAGWDGAPKQPAPGFPTDGRWNVRFEGLSPAP
jgi:hypothetical protein